MVKRFHNQEFVENMWHEYIGIDNLPVWDEIEILWTLKRKLRWRDVYALYLQSKYWKECRKRVMARDGFKCVKCKSTSNLHVDHMRYGDMGFENLKDLQLLCYICHSEKTKLVDLKATTTVKVKKMKNKKVLNQNMFELLRR